MRECILALVAFVMIMVMVTMITAQEMGRVDLGDQAISDLQKRVAALETFNTFAMPHGEIAIHLYTKPAKEDWNCPACDKLFETAVRFRQAHGNVRFWLHDVKPGETVPYLRFKDHPKLEGAHDLEVVEQWFFEQELP